MGRGRNRRVSANEEELPESQGWWAGVCNRRHPGHQSSLGIGAWRWVIKGGESVRVTASGR